jgi:hypothetical protein
MKKRENMHALLDEGFRTGCPALAAGRLTLGIYKPEEPPFLDATALCRGGLTLGISNAQST